MRLKEPFLNFFQLNKAHVKHLNTRSQRSWVPFLIAYGILKVFELSLDLCLDIDKELLLQLFIVNTFELFCLLSRLNRNPYVNHFWRIFEAGHIAVSLHAKLLDMAEVLRYLHEVGAALCCSK